VIPAPFAYERATSLDAALQRLASNAGDIKAIAGGQSLLPLMKLRLARPERLLDIGRLPELRGIGRLGDGRLAIGALTTWSELMADEQVMVYGLLGDAIPTIGDVQVRNRGTIGGSVVHADPVATIAAPLLALGAEVVARSARGERVIPITELFLGPFTPDLAPDELVTEIRLPGGSGTIGSAYRALPHPASGYPVAGVAVAIGRLESGPGPWDFAAIAVTGAGEMPYRASEAEANLIAAGSAERIERDTLASLVTQGQTIGSDTYAGREYRAAMAGVMALRALDAALERLG
jgi:carbon-monoxide dehydrogenase medium subunit